jgi:hypothetical protein
MPYWITRAEGCPMRTAKPEILAPTSAATGAERARHFNFCGVRAVKKYMVVETYREGCLAKVYERFHKHGRMMPAGLNYLDSWLEKDGARCFQLMETNTAELFAEWIPKWEDLVQFEIIEIGPKPTA